MDARMVIWNSYCETDPAITKKVKVRGGFTAIDAQAQLQNGTKLFGPYGHLWGMRDAQWSTLELGEVTLLCLDVWFYYPVLDINGNPIGEEGGYPISTDMELKPHDECRKKLMTDARSKAMSLLGFNADIFLGLYDDNRYVQGLKQKFSSNALMERAITAAREAFTEEQQLKIKARCETLLAEDEITKQQMAKILEALPNVQEETIA